MKITEQEFVSLAREGKLAEIEAIFESDDYTRHEKISLIEAENVFNTFIFLSRDIVMPIGLTLKAMRLLGERLSTETCIQALHDYVSLKGQEHQQHAQQILQVFFDELRDTKFIRVRYTVFCKVLMNPSLHSTLCSLLESGCVDKEMLLIRPNEMTILELALSLHAKCEFSSTVKAQLKWNRKDFLLDALLLVDETKILFKRCRKLKVVDIKDNRQDGHSILFDFAYYEHKEFVPVVKRILDIGGLELLSLTNIKDASAKTILHLLPSRPNVHVEMYDVLANCRDAVMLLDQNKKTPLHAACENSRLCCVDVFLKHGGRDLTWKRDSQGNTPLHLLPVRRVQSFEIFEKIVKVGGLALICFKNKANREPFAPFGSFFREALFFQISKLKESIETTNRGNDDDELMTHLKIKNEFMKREIHELKIQVAREKNRVKDAVKFQFYRVEEKAIAKMIGEFQVEKERLRHQISSEKSQGQLEIETIKSMYNESLEVIEKTKDEIMRLEGLLESQKKDNDGYKALNEQLQKEQEERNLEVARLAAANKQLQQQRLSIDKKCTTDLICKATSSRVTYQVEENQAKKKEFEQQLQKELECSICFDPFNDPHIVPECCHRFCLKCIETAIKHSGKECPMCRKRITSKRSLRRDDLIGKITKVVYSYDAKGGDKNQVTVAMGIQQHGKGEKSTKNGIDSQEDLLQQRASQLEKQIAEKDEVNLSLKVVINSKEQENDALKKEINTLKLQFSSSLNKRSRDENESNDNDDDYIIPKKRSKTKETVASQHSTNEVAANLTLENEYLLQQLKKEKASHLKTIECLENARKALKSTY
ncbi:hypothetical protein CTEN210_00931 [Chaetoceros tenuissimus]|uniref:RING-type E3 ubiquitin transferase n=1 Tax=Chaetoceros tenuissimus TaxID=426638 RepID=A0AAD3CE59_9STRA|nr:hypothetical protein CTEN210_00931 [Chaetoceros tenuissimus]